MGDRLGVVDPGRKERLPRREAMGHGVGLPDVAHQGVEPVDDGHDLRTSLLPPLSQLVEGGSDVGVLLDRLQGLVVEEDGLV